MSFTDIASLGFGIDSSQAIQAQQNLDSMTRAAVEAQKQQQLLTQLAQEHAMKLGQLNQTMSDHQKSIQQTNDLSKIASQAFKDMGTAVDGVSNSFAILATRLQGINIKEKIDEAVQAYSTLRDLSNSLGASTSGFTKFATGTGDIDGGLGGLSQAQILSRLNLATSDFGANGQNVRGAIAGVGVDATQFQPGQELELFRQVSSALNDMSDSYSKTMQVQQIFGNSSIQTMKAILVNAREVSAQEQEAMGIEEALAKRRAQSNLDDFQGSRNDGQKDADFKRLTTARSSLSSANLGRDFSPFQDAVNSFVDNLVKGKASDVGDKSDDVQSTFGPFLQSLKAYLAQSSMGLLTKNQQQSVPDSFFKDLGLSAPNSGPNLGGPENYTVQTFQESITKRKNMQSEWFTWSAAKEKESWDYAYQAAVDGGQKNNVILQQIDDQRTASAKAAAAERRQIADIEFGDQVSASSSNPYSTLNLQGQRLGDFKQTRTPIEIAQQQSQVNRGALSAQQYTSSAFHSLTIGNIQGDASVQNSLDQSQVQTAQLAERAGIISTLSRQTIELTAAQDAYNAKIKEAAEIDRDANDPTSATSRNPQAQASAIQKSRLMTAEAQAALDAKKQQVALEIPMADQQKQSDNERAVAIEKVAMKYAAASAEVRKYYTDLAGTQYDINKQTPGDTGRQNAAADLANQAQGRQLGDTLLGQNSGLRNSNSSTLAQINVASQGDTATQMAQIQAENDLLRTQAALIKDPDKKKADLDLIATHQQLQVEQLKLNAALSAEKQIRQNDQDIQLLQYEASLTGVSADERQRLVNLKKEEFAIDQQNISPGQKNTLVTQASDKSLEQQRVNDMNNEAKLQQQIVANSLNNIDNAFGKFFTGVNTGATKNWQSMTQSLSQSFNDALGQMEAALITRPLIGAFLRALGGDDFARSMGFGGSGSGGGIATPNGGFLGGLFGSNLNGNQGGIGANVGDYSIADMAAYTGGAYAKGGAWSGGTRFLATGGLLDGPTQFTDMGGTRMNVGGEAGTEAVMPLTRGSDGNLGVRSHGQQGGNINIDARGSQVGVEQRIRAVLAQERPGIIQQSTSASVAAVRFHADSGGPFSVTVGRRRR